MPGSATLTIRAVEAARLKSVWHSLLVGGVNAANREAEAASISRAPADPASTLCLWEAWRGDRLRGAIGARIEPGRIAQVLPPRLAPDENATAANLLWSQLDQALRSADVALAYAHVDRDDHDARRMFELGAYRHHTDVLLAVRPAVAAERSAKAGATSQAEVHAISCTPLLFQPVGAAELARLSELVRQTYVGSQDFPFLNGARTADDVLAGYAATGDSAMRGWRFVRCGDRDVGCVLAADHSGEEICELLYLGLVPAARGQGWGREMLNWAIQWANDNHRRPILVAVDANNAPAIALYAAAGFMQTDRRATWTKLI